MPLLHRFSSLVEKLTSLSSFPPFSSVHDSNQTNNPSFEFSTSSKVEKISKNGRIEEQSFEGLNLGNKELLQASEVPIQAQDGRCDELILLTLKGKNEGGTTEGDAKEKMEALFLSLHSDNKRESIEDDQMVLEEGSGALPSS